MFAKTLLNKGMMPMGKEENIRNKLLKDVCLVN